MENCLVPLMSCAISISEDLSAATLTQELDTPWLKMSTGSGGFPLVDVAVVAALLIATAALALSLTFSKTIA